MKDREREKVTEREGCKRERIRDAIARRGKDTVGKKEKSE